MKPRPLIGLTPYEKLGDAGIWMRGTYIRSILNAGGLPVTLPFLTREEEFDAVCRSMDGFLFTGGDDIDPARYGEAILPECGELCPARVAEVVGGQRGDVEGRCWRSAAAYRS